MKPDKEEVKYDEDLPGNYPASEDIFRKGMVVPNIDPENLDKEKSKNVADDVWNEKSFEDDVSGDDLDVPGAELDDADEDIGNEDEENNYYSLGGDNHNDLEENQGD